MLDTGIEPMNLLQCKATSMDFEGDTPFDSINWYSQPSDTNMNSEGGTPAELSPIPQADIGRTNWLQRGTTSMNPEGDTPFDPIDRFSQHSATNMNSEDGTPAELSPMFKAGIDRTNWLQRDTTSMNPEGDTPFDPIDRFLKHGATNMNFQCGTPTELSPMLETDINPASLYQPLCESGMNSPTRSSFHQGGLTPGLCSRVEKWTPDMEAFLVEKKLQGDTLALIAKQMEEKFGVFVNPNILTKRSTKIIENLSKDNIVVRAITAAEGRIIKVVKDEIKQLNIPNEDFLDEVNKEMLRKLPDVLKVLGVKLWTREQRSRAKACNNANQIKSSLDSASSSALR